MAGKQENAGPDVQMFVISVAAELAGMHAQTLRTYDRLGLVTPQRTSGGGRRYSPRDVALLREVTRAKVHAPDAMPADVVTMGATAAHRLLERTGTEGVRTLMFATETGVDQSKSTAVYVHKLLDLPGEVRSFELKQACYSGTGALQAAIGIVARIGPVGGAQAPRAAPRPGRRPGTSGCGGILISPCQPEAE